jgi:hypothetical protein
MKAKMIFVLTFASFIFANGGYASRIFAADPQSNTKNQKIDVDIGINKEDRDVGLKRMEIIEKALSPELIERKRLLVHTVEQDYDVKISRLLQRLTTPIGHNTVITHLDVNFFDTDFESQIYISQKVSVSVILGRDGFEKWTAGKTSEEEAINQIKLMIHNTFKIPDNNISIAVAPN